MSARVGPAESFVMRTLRETYRDGDMFAARVLCAQVGCSQSSVYRYLRRLEFAGLIRTDRCSGKGIRVFFIGPKVTGAQG